MRGLKLIVTMILVIGVLATPALGARRGTITGHLDACTLFGGCHRQARIEWCPPTKGGGCLWARQVEVLTASGQRVALLDLHRGRFRLSVSIGRYTLELLGDGSGGQNRVMVRRTVRTRAGKTTSVALKVEREM